MDKLAKVASVSIVASGAIVASVLSYSVLKMAAFEPKVRMGRTVPAFEAELKLPEAPLFAPMAEPKRAQAAAPAPKPDLARAFGAALNVAPKKVAAPPAPVAIAEPEPLDLGFKAPAREANLAQRAVKSTSMQQLGGAERQRSRARDDARVHFDVDLAAPR